MSQYGQYVTEESVQNNSGNIKFGLNKNAYFVKIIKVSPEDSNSETGALDFIFKLGDTEIKRRIFPITSVKDKETNVEIKDPNNEQFKSAIAKQQGWFTSFFKVFTTETKLKAALEAAVKAKPNFGFFDYVNCQYSTIPKEIFAKTPIDLFLEYSTGKDGKQYLSIPSSRVHGKFITQSMAGEYKEVMDNNGLSYINEQGHVHEIQRSAWWLNNMDSAKKITNMATNPTNPTNPVMHSIMSSPASLHSHAFTQPANDPMPSAPTGDDMDW